MKKLIIGVLALLLSVYVALWLSQEGGFVIVTVGDWTIQTSVLLFVGAIVVAVAAIWLLVGLLRRLFGMPARVQRWRLRRGRRLAHSELIEGLVRLIEGRDTEGRKKLLSHVDRSDLPVLHLLGAAIAAQRQRDYEQRDRLLSEALTADSRARLAVGLVQAELQVEAEQWERALATLNYLSEKAPRSPRLLKLLLRTSLALKDDERLAKLLPELSRNRVLSESEVKTLERELFLRRAAAAQSLVELERLWGELNKAQHEDPALVHAYASALARVHALDEAEQLLRKRLQKGWNEDLVRLYGEIEGGAPDRQLSQLEKWLQGRPDDAALLYAAGRQALRARIWSRARDYLEAAVARDAGVASKVTLAALLAKMQDRETALELYGQAFEQLELGAPLPELSEAEENALAAHAAGHGA